MREQWSDSDLRAELSRRPTPVPVRVIDALRQAYPGARPVEIYAHTVNQGGLAYRVDAVSVALHKAALNAAPAFLYMFAWKTRVLDGRPRAFHRSELPFVFDNTDRCAHQTGGTQEARAMAARMADTWIAFARTGDPQHARLPRWPAFTPDRVPTMVFDNVCEVRHDHDRDARLAWDAATTSA
jgi:para-nitrobenzyl esterase